MGSALLMSVAVTLSITAAAAAADGSLNPSANAHCRPSDFAMQCVRPGPGSARAAIESAGAYRTHAGRAHAASAYAYGVDFGWRMVSARAANVMGVQFVASYLSYDAKKNWTLGMINTYHAMGRGTICVWENAAKRALAGYAAGQADAWAAYAQEQALGVPATAPIYFAVDFDETPRQARAVASYFRGVDSVLGVDRAGAYGGYWTISRLFNAGLIQFGWQTYAWSGGRWDPRAQIEQYANYRAYDMDRAMTSSFGATY